MLSPAAVAIVDAHDIESRAEHFGGRSQHVSRRGRSLHAMPDHKRRLVCSIGLPTTARQDLAAAFDLEQTLLVAGAIAGAKSPWPKVSAESLRVPLFEQAMRNE